MSANLRPAATVLIATPYHQFRAISGEQPAIFNKGRENPAEDWIYAKSNRLETDDD